MIVCPNCNHQNPEGANQCEACYTPLSTTSGCPNCGAPVEPDATFCGQCGFNLLPEMTENTAKSTETIVNTSEIPEAEESQKPDPVVLPTIPSIETSSSAKSVTMELEKTIGPDPAMSVNIETEETGNPSEEKTEKPTTPSITPPTNSPTKLQTYQARLLHLQSNTTVEIPQNLPVVHIGKPNEQIPPDIDVAGFSDSEIVSRVHAEIRLEGDAFFIEDLGSSNGTYINHTPLLPGNRHRLRAGDRIALGKEDKVTFIFELS